MSSQLPFSFMVVVMRALKISLNKCYVYNTVLLTTHSTLDSPSYTWKLVPFDLHLLISPTPPAPGNHGFIFGFLGFLDSVCKSYRICLPLSYFTSHNETSRYRPKAVVLKCQRASESPGGLPTTGFQASARNFCFPRSREGPENLHFWQMPSRCC